MSVGKSRWLRIGAAALLFATFDTGVLAQDTGDIESTPQEYSPQQREAALQPTAFAEPEAIANLPSSLADKVSIGLNFEITRLFDDVAAGGSGFIPPDTMGSVGPAHIVEMINGNFEIFDKFTGQSLESRSLDSFWTTRVGLGILNSGRFDPRVVFDPDSERWFAVSIDRSIDTNGDDVRDSGNNIFVGRSDTDDPTGDWDGFSFDADTVGAEEFHDYPTLAVDADGLYTCTQDFDAGGNESCYSIPKADLLLATPSVANLTRFEATPAGLPGTNGSIQPALDFGLSDGRAALLGSTGTALRRTNIFGAAGAGATLGTPVALTGDPGHTAPPAARQPHPVDPAVTIENVAPRFVANVFEEDESLWAVHAVDGSGSNSALRWYEIDEATNTVVQTGLIDDPDRDFHEPSIAVNHLGHVVIGYTCSGPTLSPSVCVSVGETSGGVTTFEPPAILFTGLGHYYRDFGDGRNRWGDYSATVIDPVDSCTFWTFQEYVSQSAVGDVRAGNEGGLWGTRVAELTFNSCAGGDLKVTKDCKPDQPLVPGEDGFCNILVQNLGPGPALDVAVVDRYISNGTFFLGVVTTTAGTCTATSNPQIGQGEVNCDLGRMSAGEEVTIRVPVTALEPQDIDDHVSVSSSTPDPNLENNQDEDRLTTFCVADLSLIKLDFPDPVTAGNLLTYTLQVANNGPSTATNAVVEDVLPAGVTIVSVSATGGASCNAGVPGDPDRPTVCAFDSLSVGELQTMTIVVRVLPQTVGVLHNDAQASSDTADLNNANDLVTEDTTVVGSADVSVVKTVASPSGGTVNAGALLTYQIEVSNAGPSTAQDVEIHDTLPPEVSFVSHTVLTPPGNCSLQTTNPDQIECQISDLDPGDTWIVNLTVLVDSSVPNGASFDNTATVTSPTPDPALGNNSSTAGINVAALADIWIDKTGRMITGNPSRTILYNLRVYNQPGCEIDDPLSCGEGGPSDARNIVVVDALPLDAQKMKVVFVSANCSYDPGTHDVTCTTPVIPAGASAAFRIDVQVKGSVGDITNEVSVSSSTADPTPGNNADSLKMKVKGGSARPGQ